MLGLASLACVQPCRAALHDCGMPACQQTPPPHYIHRDPKKPAPPNTLSYNAIISQYSVNKFYEMFEEVKD